MKKDILKNKILFKKYKLITKIGKGSFGFVYSGVNLKDNTKVAVKLEDKNGKVQTLEKESYFLSLLKGVGIPEIMSYGYNQRYYILVQELLGENLGDILKESKHLRLSIKDIAMIALQIIDRIEFVHSKNIVHRDMKPENFLFGLENETLLYLIDFGISRKYRSSRTGKHIKYSLTGKLFGTLKYLSYNATRGVEQTRRDDLESIGYILVSLSGSKLPWQGYSIHCAKAKTNYEKILELKRISKPEIICNFLPEEFCEYIKYCRKLNFEQEPDYEHLRNLFKKVLIKYRTINDLNFSWLKRNKKVLGIKDKIDEKDEAFYSLSKEKYINLLRRKASPQIRLYHAIQKSLLSDYSADKIVALGKQTIEEQNKSYNIHKRRISSDSTNFINSNHSNLSREGPSNDSVKVQYNVNIAEIGEEIKKEKLLNQKNSVIGKLKKNLLTNKNKNDNKSFNKNIFNLDKNSALNFSLNLDKNYIMDNNITKNNKKKIRSQSPKHRAKESNVIYSEKEIRRKSLCKNIYENIIKKININLSTMAKQLKTKKANRMIPKRYNKIPYQINNNNLSSHNFNKINYLREERKTMKKIPNKINFNKTNDFVMNNNMHIKCNTINSNNLIEPRKVKILKSKTINRVNIIKKRNNSNVLLNNQNFNISGMNSPKLPDKRIIIINNNISSYPDSYTSHKYISIKERKEAQSKPIISNFYNSSNNNNAFNSIISDNKKILSSDDNYIKHSLNNMNDRILHLYNKNNNMNNTRKNIQDINQKMLYSNNNINTMIEVPKRMIINRSNDDINKRVPKRNIKVYNYKSIIKRSQPQTNKTNLIGKKKHELNKIYLNPNLKRLTKNNIKTMKMNTYVSNQKQNSNNIKKYGHLLSRVNNNSNISNDFLPKQYFSIERNLDRIILTKKHNYSNNINNNIYYKLEKNNNQLFSSKSNINFLENMSHKKSKNPLEYINTNSEDSKSFGHIPNNFNKLYEEKTNYKYNKYNNELNFASFN